MVETGKRRPKEPPAYKGEVAKEESELKNEVVALARVFERIMRGGFTGNVSICFKDGKPNKQVKLSEQYLEL